MGHKFTKFTELVWEGSYTRELLAMRNTTYPVMSSKEKIISYNELAA